MNPTRDRLAIGELTRTLAGRFDLATVLDTVAHDARYGFDASSAAIVLLDRRSDVGHSDARVVAEALRTPTDHDLSFVSAGPGLVSARDGAVTMIADLADLAAHADGAELLWPAYRRAAREAGMRGMRAFPVVVMGVSLGALVVHTDDPWGNERPNDFGQILANLTAIAVSTAPQGDRRRSDTWETIDTLLRGTVAIATATGIVAEQLDLEPSHARLALHRMARAHQNTVSAHAEAIVAAFDRDPSGIGASGLLAAPSELPEPPHIGA
ncbi:hypothetical protein ASG82_03970 [Mycobacterium sp. Soil538]|nr:hypothetical protein ASG82_03970 [Mycobacterium sp. Soil538]